MKQVRRRGFDGHDGVRQGPIPVERREKAAGGQHERPPRKDDAPIVDPMQVTSGHVGHADGPRRAVEELVTIPVDTDSGDHHHHHHHPLLPDSSRL